MKTPRSRAYLARSILVVAFAATMSAPAWAQKVDPDPELFDGTRTKTKDEKKNDKTVDDWEGANLIVYDSDEEGNGKGGQGRSGQDQPGMDIAGPGAGVGLPLPIGSGGGASPSSMSASIPTPGAGGMPPSTMTAPPATIPTNMTAPTEMAIGDASQTIAMTQMPGSPMPPPPAGDEEGGATQDNKNSTGGDQVPKAANTNQSRARGVGVEKGDAMPSDL